MSKPNIDDLIVNIDSIAETPFQEGEYFEGPYKPLTPALEPRIGRLGMNVTRVPPGKTGAPFHTHQIEDEVFFVLSGRGVLRYGDEIRELRPGDCISCPAGTGTAHQLANPFDQDFIFLAAGMNDPNEVCTYPDSGKISLRSLGRKGMLRDADYFEGELGAPKVFALAKGRGFAP